MTELKYKLIASDLDLTLLDNKGNISDNTLRSIEQYRQLGGAFTIATGRSEEAIKNFTDMLGGKTPFITFNGGKVVDISDGSVISESFLDAQNAKLAYVKLRELGKDVVVYINNRRYVAAYTDIIEKYIRRIQHEVNLIDDIDAVVGDGKSLKKILVIDPAQESELIIGALKPVFGETLNCVKSDDEFYEIMPFGASKGGALKLLADYLNINIAETIAIGDHFNDISMIEAAGLGIAVANAKDEVLKAADYITSSNDRDGVAKVIQNVIEGRAFIRG